jgi:biotin carboxyl carrier protein
VAVKVAPGDEVSPGQSLIVLEAMKMENELSAEQAGRVAVVHVTDGATVEGGELLIELE